MGIQLANPCDSQVPSLENRHGIFLVPWELSLPKCTCPTNILVHINTPVNSKSAKIINFMRSSSKHFVVVAATL